MRAETCQIIGAIRRTVLDRRQSPARGCPQPSGRRIKGPGVTRPHGPKEFEIPRLLIVIGVVLIAVGLAWLAGERLGLGRLPGDFVFQRGNTRVYVPVTTSILVSLALTLIFWLLGR